MGYAENNKGKYSNEKCTNKTVKVVINHWKCRNKSLAMQE